MCSSAFSTGGRPPSPTSFPTRPAPPWTGGGAAPAPPPARGITPDVSLGFLDRRTAAVADEFPDAAVATMDGSRGTPGTVLDAAPDLRGYPTVYACGPHPMPAAGKG